MDRTGGVPPELRSIIVQALDGDRALAGIACAELSADDLEGWAEGDISGESMQAYVQAVAQRLQREAGKVPVGYAHAARCQHCGPVWLPVAGPVLGCPWCHTRAQSHPVPKPVAVQCADCRHFERGTHPHIGRCLRGHRRGRVGNWANDHHHCPYYQPEPTA